jgi:hypothetical protein
MHHFPRTTSPYAEPMGQGDVPASPGGPLRRRREKRQLGKLAEKSDREVSPTASKAHTSQLASTTMDSISLKAVPI